MNRLFLAAAVLLGGVGYAHADYVKLIINLASSKEETPEGEQPGFPGMPGFAGGLGGQGMMGPGAGSGSMPGMAGMQRGGGGKFGGGKFGGGSPPGAPGMRGEGTGGFNPGYPGAGGGFPGQGQFPGARGSGFPGQLPAGGGLGGGEQGVGSSDAPGSGMMQMMGFSGGEGDFDEPESSPFYVEAVIELDSKMNKKEEGWYRGWNYHQSSGRLAMKHKWGTTSLYLPREMKKEVVGNTTILTSKEIQIVHVKFPTVEEQYEAKRKAVEKDATPGSLVEEAEWVLAHGLTDEVAKIMDTLAKKEPKHPAVVAFKKLQADLARDLGKDDGANAWRERLGDDYKVKQSKHYTLLYDVAADAPADERLGRLEANFKAFYYWFALRGKVLPMPDRRLLAVLVDSQEAFDHQHQDIFDNVPMTTDGFLVPRENIAVFSSKRQDEAYAGLVKLAQPLQQDYDRKKLLEGKGWRRDTSPQQTAYAQTLALLLQANEDEGERLTISHDGTRQLIRAIGLVPRNVKLPHWLDFGLAAFFETPKGAFWPGPGAPSWNYLVRYKSWEAAKKLDKPEEALKNVVSDLYFQQAAEAKDAKDKEKAETKAHTMSWALMYYLLREKRDGVLRYFEELGSLPRDMELDGDVLVGCFARAFDLVDASKLDLTRPAQVDAGKLLNFGNQWNKYLRLTNLEVAEVMNKAILDYKKALAEKPKEVKPPDAANAQNRPGGFPGTPPVGFQGQQPGQGQAGFQGRPQGGLRPGQQGGVRPPAGAVQGRVTDGK